MKNPILLALLAIGLGASLLADEKKIYPQISFVEPVGSKSSVLPDEYLILVVEPGFISHEDKPIPVEALLTYVDDMLKARKASYIAVHIREGIKFGDVVKALDLLRQSSAKSIGVSMRELPLGKRT